MCRLPRIRRGHWCLHWRLIQTKSILLLWRFQSMCQNIFCPTTSHLKRTAGISRLLDLGAVTSRCVLDFCNNACVGFFCLLFLFAVISTTILLNIQFYVYLFRVHALWFRKPLRLHFGTSIPQVKPRQRHRSLYIIRTAALCIVHKQLPLHVVLMIRVRRTVKSVWVQSALFCIANIYGKPSYS